MSLTPDGIHLIPIEMPSDSSPVNVYLVEDDPLTLLDTGPNLPTTLAQLDRAFAELGHSVQDLERIVLTHPHIDHIGVASILRDRSGAEVWAPAGTEAWLANYQGHGAWLKGWRDSLMLLHGVPEEVVSTSTHGAAFRNSWDPSVEVDRVMREGDTVPFAERSWLVLFRPGHSPHDVLLDDHEHELVFSGDHLIEHISSNALITPDHGQSPQERPHTLATYRRSLEQTAALPPALMLSGHGIPITDHRQLIARRLASMDRRTAAIKTIVEQGPCTAHEIALRIWDDRARARAWLTISEVLGHVDRLICASWVREIRDDSARVRFEAARIPRVDDQLLEIPDHM